MNGGIELPYHGTEGFVARPASMARAVENATTGVARRRQRQVCEHLEPLPAGATWREIGAALHLHHGQVSASLSVLHRAGAVFQLRETRDRCHPYVHGKWRGCFLPSQRFDEPTRTSAAVARERIETALLLLDDGLDRPDELRRLVRDAVAVLRGER